MNTQDVMRLALTVSDLDSVPGDSSILHPHEDTRRILRC